MIKHIPLPIDILNAAVNGAGRGFGHGISLVTQIGIGNDHTTVNKISVRVTAGSISQLVVLAGGINQIIGISDLANRRCFIEGVMVKRAVLRGGGFAVQHGFWRRFYRHHIRFQLHNSAGKNAGLCRFDLRNTPPEQLALYPIINWRKQSATEIPNKSPTIVQPDTAIIMQDSRVVGQVFQHRRSIRVLNISQVFKWTAGVIGYRHGHGTEILRIGPHGTVVQIIPSIVSPHAVRGVVIYQLSGL